MAPRWWTDKQCRCCMNFNQGYTLVEVLVALAILGMTAAFIGGIYTALTASQVNTEFINAEDLAKSQMESVMRQPYVTVEDY